MELSNLRPAEGSKQSNEFRRGRGHGSGNGKTAGKATKVRKHVPVQRDQVSKVVRCLYIEDFQREASNAEILKKLLQ